jgi:SAM-dependent methyltransferase
MAIEELRHRYKGSVATDYVKRRENTPQWKMETKHVGTFVSRFAARRVLDLPVGTGRFMDLFAKYNNSVIGLDSSQEMVNLARQQAELFGTKIICLETADALHLDHERYNADFAVCIRFMNWLDNRHACIALGNICRAVTDAIIVGIRTADLTRVSGAEKAAVIKKLEEQKSSCSTPVNYLHVKSDVDSWFSGWRLHVEEALSITKGARGYEYNIYLLRKLK